MKSRNGAPRFQLDLVNRGQAEIVQQMRDEIAMLKGQKAKPKFKPSGKVAPTVPITDHSRFKGYRDFIVQDLHITDSLYERHRQDQERMSY